MKRGLLLLLFYMILADHITAQAGFEVIVVGEAPRSVLDAEELFPWYKLTYQTYQPDIESIEKLKKTAPGHTFLIFAGTWCKDTKRELPRFFKVADAAAIPKEDIRLIFLDRNKKAKDNSAEENKITHIPTFILLLDGKEKGRIVEETKQSMEKDLLDLLVSP
jgi:thiol-disulfide isomerase/thioredoxin